MYCLSSEFVALFGQCKKRDNKWNCEFDKINEYDGTLSTEKVEVQEIHLHGCEGVHAELRKDIIDFMRYRNVSRETQKERFAKEFTEDPSTIESRGIKVEIKNNRMLVSGNEEYPCG